MIGTILSMKFVGKKGWKDSIVFWLVYLVLSTVILGVISGLVVGNVYSNIADFPDDWETKTPAEQQQWIENNLGSLGSLGILGVLSIIISVSIFLIMAHYWYKFNWWDSIKIFAIAYIFDIIIVLVLGFLFFGIAILLMPEAAQFII